VREVKLDVKGEKIDVQVVHDEGVRWPCPECGELLTVYDHAPERVWRHLDTCQFKTYLHARIPRVNCPDLALIREHVPGAEDKLVFDRYHLMRHLVQAVDNVHKQEHRELKREGLGVLAVTKYLWLYSQENLPPEKRSLFYWLKKKRLKTARAWAIKESFRELWDYQSLGWAAKHFKSWYAWAIRSRLNPIKQVARMFRKYLRNILTYLKHRITNAVSEGINSTIQTIKKMACGFRNREHFKIAIYFHCGGLDLYPGTHENI